MPVCEMGRDFGISCSTDRESWEIVLEIQRKSTCEEITFDLEILCYLVEPILLKNYPLVTYSFLKDRLSI
jgi:hypothetical protein